MHCDKEKKRQPEKTQLQAPRLHLLYDLPPRTTGHRLRLQEQAEEKKKQAKKQRKPKSGKDEVTTERNRVGKLSY